MKQTINNLPEFIPSIHDEEGWSVAPEVQNRKTSMNVNLKSLIARLNDTCRSALEGAAGLCLSRTNYDVEIEHLLIKLLEAQDSDLLRILNHFEVGLSRMNKDLTRAL